MGRKDHSEALFRALLPLVLASKSPRRREMLSRLGLEFEILAGRAQEPEALAHERPEDLAVRRAEIKAREAAALRPDAAVLAADTIVVLGRDVLGKPRDRADALRMLGLLNGRTHAVVTGCCLALPGKGVKSFFASTEVTMRRAGPDELAAYAATDEPLDKAGAYAIQERGAFLVQRVCGSYTNVVGLPLAKVMELLLYHNVVSPVK